MATNLTKLVGEHDEILEFLEFIIASAPPSFLLPVVGINKAAMATGGQPKLTWKFFHVYELQEAAQYASALHSDNLDVYIVPSLFREIPPAGKRGGKEYVAGSSLLWVDKDYKDGGSKDETMRQVARESNPPSLVIDSGNGLHLYWKLDTFLTSVDDIENRNRFLCKRRFQADDCFSSEHLMRVPGLRNLKDPTNPKKVRIISRDGFVYSAADFDILGSDEAIETSGPIEEEEYDPEMLARLPEELRERIQEGPQGEDRSSNDWFVACALIENGYTPGQVLSIFLNPDFGVGEKARENISYAFRTIKKAGVEARRRLALKPRAVLQVVIDKMVFQDKNGANHLDLPVQGYHIISEACQVLEKQGYRFVYDDVDNLPYIITAQGEIIRASTGDRNYNGWLSHITLFTAESRAFKMFQSGIVAYIQEHGKHTTIKPWTYLDLDRARFYVLTDHTKSGRVAYITAGDSHVVHGGNGIDNFILFPSEITFGHDLEIVEDLATIDMAQSLSGLFDLTHDYFAVHNDMKAFLTCYMLACPIASAFVKHGMLPLLHLTGRPGQGKTEALKILSAWLQGSVSPESGTTVPGARAIAARDILLPLDDYEEMPKPLKEFILTSATGAVRHKSDMVQGSAVGIVGQKNHILVALSSVSDLPTDTLRRRALRIELSHEQHPTEKFNSMFKDKILRGRSLFWNGYMKFVLQNVMGRLSITNYYQLVEKVSAEITVSEFKPMSEFVALCWFIAQQLATFDKRFAMYTDDISSITGWLQYFELLNKEAIESYNELLGMLEHMGESYLRDINMGETNNGLLKNSPRTPTGSLMISTPLWMQGLCVELPRGVPEPPFDLAHCVCVSGKMQSWIATLVKMGNRDYFSSMANPARQMLTAIKNLAGIVSKVHELNKVVSGGFKYTGLFRLGQSNMYVQFIFTTGTNPIIRLFWAYDPEQYSAPVAPVGPRVPTSSLAASAAEIKSRVVRGDYTPEEIADMVSLLTLYKGSLDTGAVTAEKENKLEKVDRGPLEG